MYSRMYCACAALTAAGLSSDSWRPWKMAVKFAASCAPVTLCCALITLSTLWLQRAKKFCLATLTHAVGCSHTHDNHASNLPDKFETPCDLQQTLADTQSSCRNVAQTRVPYCN